MEMYLAGVSTRRIEGVCEILWKSSISAATVSQLKREGIRGGGGMEERSIERECPYVFMDGIYLKRSWGESFENVAIVAAIDANNDGYRDIICAAEEFTESIECWRDFLS